MPSSKRNPKNPRIKRKPRIIYILWCRECGCRVISDQNNSIKCPSWIGHPNGPWPLMELLRFKYAPL